MYKFIFFLIFSLPFFSYSQQNVFDDFEGNGTISTWAGDGCGLNTSFSNPFPQGINTSLTVLEYQDQGGDWANIRFDVSPNFNFDNHYTFSIKIYVPSSSITGNQPNQVSLKLQDGTQAAPWATQSEIIKPLLLDQWQTLTFNFKNDTYINLDPASPPPTERTDFNRVLIQVNSEGNNDQVTAYIDDVQYDGTVGGNNSPFTELVWSDEFDGSGDLDLNKWFRQHQLPVPGGWFNGEIQHYTDREDNSFRENGVLRILAKRENYFDQGVTKEFTSARLNSKFAFQYGRVEVRAKLPFGPGTWPAIWMLGKNINENGAYWQTQGFGTTGWPACGEVDIMEHWGTNQNFVSSAIHTPSSFGGTVNYGGQAIANASDAYHLYVAEWSEEEITFSVDGNVYYTYNPDVKDADTWPFDQEMYFILNVAMLPTVEPSFTESSMDIDYIRVFQEGITAVNNLSETRIPKVWPNPVQDELRFEWSATDSQILDIVIYDIFGRTILKRKVATDNGFVKVDGLGDLPGGMFIVRGKSKGNRISFKFLKQ